jgi:hypothetical protein
MNPVIEETLAAVCEEIADRYARRDRSGCPCECHMWVFVSISCPPDCPEIAGRFDGCHDCDCKTGKHRHFHVTNSQGPGTPGQDETPKTDA